MSIKRIHFKFVFGIFLSLVTFEFILNITEATPLWNVLPVIRPILGQPDKDLGYTLTPNVSGIWTKENRAKIMINNYGMRDSYISEEKPENQFRVGLTGDSVTEALQVNQDETFDNITEEIFLDEGHDVKLLNFAMSGNGPLRQLLKLKKDGFKHNLDLVVSITSISDFNTNELIDDSTFPAYIFNDDGDLVIGYGFRDRRSTRYIDTIGGKVFMWIYQNSRVFNSSYTKLKNASFPNILISNDNESESQNEKDYCSSDSINNYLTLWKYQNPKKNWLAKNKFFEDYAKSLKLNELRGIYLLNGIPLPREGCPKFNEMRNELIEIINNELSDQNIEFVDLRKHIYENLPENISIDQLNGFNRNLGTGHLNYLGHEIYAKTLYKIIKSQYFEIARKY